jgi:hypothetical protein
MFLAASISRQMITALTSMSCSLGELQQVHGTTWHTFFGRSYNRRLPYPCEEVERNLTPRRPVLPDDGDPGSGHGGSSEVRGRWRCRRMDDPQLQPTPARGVCRTARWRKVL